MRRMLGGWVGGDQPRRRVVVFVVPDRPDRSATAVEDQGQRHSASHAERSEVAKLGDWTLKDNRGEGRPELAGVDISEDAAPIAAVAPLGEHVAIPLLVVDPRV